MFCDRCFGIQHDILMPHRLILYVAIFKAHHISVNLFLNFYYYFVLKKNCLPFCSWFSHLLLCKVLLN
jgi:hypothetical protein